MRALQPAKVKEVRLDDDTGTATVIVHDYQLSLAIGKEGQNARLAARLTGWRVDIKSETQLAEEQAAYAGEEWAEGEWVQNEAGEMVWQPAEGGDAVSAAEWAGNDTAADAAPGAAESAANEPAAATEPAVEAGTRETVITETVIVETVADDVAADDTAVDDVAVDQVVVAVAQPVNAEVSGGEDSGAGGEVPA